MFSCDDSIHSTDVDGGAAASLLNQEKLPLVDPEVDKKHLHLKPVPKRYEAFNGMRLLAAVHIVFYHFWAAEFGHNFQLYGPTWLNFFFMLAGLGAAQSRLASGEKQNENWHADWLPKFGTLLRRIMAVYPTYVVALIAIVLVGTSAIEDCFLLELFMLQTYWDECRTGWNSPAWFVSSLVVCWLAERAIFRSLMLVRQRVGETRLLPVVASPCFVGLWFSVFYNLQWWAQWWQGLPFYIIGTTLAITIADRTAAGARPRHGAALVAFVILFAIFIFVPYNKWELHDPNAVWNALLWPLQAILILGLCDEADPLARFLLTAPLPTLGTHLTLGVYLLQLPVHIWLPSQNVLEPRSFARLLAVLILAAALVNIFVQEPLQRWVTTCADGSFPFRVGQAAELAT